MWPLIIGQSRIPNNKSQRVCARAKRGDLLAKYNDNSRQTEIYSRGEEDRCDCYTDQVSNRIAISTTCSTFRTIIIRRTRGMDPAERDCNASGPFQRNPTPRACSLLTWQSYSPRFDTRYQAAYYPRDRGRIWIGKERCPQSLAHMAIAPVRPDRSAVCIGCKEW
jgi:hypothetical protein